MLVRATGIEQISGDAPWVVKVHRSQVRLYAHEIQIEDPAIGSMSVA